MPEPILTDELLELLAWKYKHLNTDERKEITFHDFVQEHLRNTKELVGC